MERELTHLSLFSGIGGLDLAAEWAGFKTVGHGMKPWYRNTRILQAPTSRRDMIPTTKYFMESG